MGFYPIEGLEEWVDVGVIGFLGSGETAFVDAVVDCVVDCVLYVRKKMCWNGILLSLTPVIHLVDIFSQMLGVESSFFFGLFFELVWKQIVEFGI